MTILTQTLTLTDHRDANSTPIQLGWEMSRGIIQRENVRGENCREGECKAAVLNLWATVHQWTADLCLVGRDQGWELRNFLCESRVTIREKVPSLSSQFRQKPA